MSLALPRIARGRLRRAQAERRHSTAVETNSVWPSLQRAAVGGAAIATHRIAVVTHFTGIEHAVSAPHRAAVFAAEARLIERLDIPAPLVPEAVWNASTGEVTLLPPPQDDGVAKVLQRVVMQVWNGRMSGRAWCLCCGDLAPRCGVAGA